jgi:hypothetical protein
VLVLGDLDNGDAVAAVDGRHHGGARRHLGLLARQRRPDLAHAPRRARSLARAHPGCARARPRRRCGAATSPARPPCRCRGSSPQRLSALPARLGIVGARKAERAKAASRWRQPRWSCGASLDLRAHGPRPWRAPPLLTSHARFPAPPAPARADTSGPTASDDRLQVAMLALQL